ncbi:Abhydrolase domain-containing protein 11, partial [Stegodyphus mimosarum]
MSKYVPVRLAYKTVEPVCGASDKPPIIFLHALTASSDCWLDIPQTIANETKRKIYLLDARNHGDSEWSDEFDLDVYSIDLVQFMDTLNIPKAALLGHSMGGMTAIKTALKEKDRVEMIIVEDMTVRKFPKAVMDMMPKSLTLIQQATEQIPSDIDENDAKKFLFEYVHNQLPPEGKELLKRRDNDAHILTSLKRNPDGGYSLKANIKAILDAVKNTETLISEPNGLYDGPAYFIYGTYSPFVGEADEPYIREFFPNAEFQAIEGATHSVHTDCPQEFTDAVLKFLSKA